MPQLMAIAEYVTKLHAICVVCGNPANHSQRLVDGDSRVLLGAKEAYEPRCRDCFDLALSKGESPTTAHPVESLIEAEQNEADTPESHKGG